jgi:hypothetical protein
LIETGRAGGPHAREAGVPRFLARRGSKIAAALLDLKLASMKSKLAQSRAHEHSRSQQSSLPMSLAIRA